MERGAGGAERTVGVWEGGLGGWGAGQEGRRAGGRSSITGRARGMGERVVQAG